MRGALEVVLVIAAFVATGAAFALPWAAAGDEADEQGISRYAMFVDGHASLVRRVDDDGRLVEWQSTTIEVMPGFRALADLPSGFVDAVAEHIAGEGAGTTEALEAHEALSRARVGLVSRRILAADGSARTEIEVEVLDRRGLYSLGFQTLGAEQAPTLFDPALPLLPANPSPGTTWSAQGQAGALGYRVAAGVSEAGPLETSLGSLPDCITVSLTLTLEVPDGPSETEQVDQYCAGVGWVHGDVRGEEPRRYDTVSVAGAVAGEPVSMPSVALETEPPPGDPGTWELSRVGSALPLSTTGKSTFAPVYVPTDPPLVLAATDAGGDLVALSAGGVVGGVAWRVPTAGAIYAQPLFDSATSRIFMGASDGVLRALDARGLFLWSHATGDSIATRPVAVGTTVVFGSEDGHVYGVDIDTGQRRWRVVAGAAVVASPALMGDFVVVADESGTVRALSPVDGAVRWTWDAPAAIVAGLATTADGVLVADTAGGLTLLDADGAERWRADAGRGSPISSQPTVGDGLVVTVDDQGDAAGVSLRDGRLAWRRTNEGYVGSPAAVGNAFVVGRDDGTLDRVDAAGELVARLDARDATTPLDLPPAFTYGPSHGGGAIWVADDHGIVRRLGPAPDRGPQPLEVAWVRTIVDPPYASLVLVSTPTPWGDRLVLLDPRRNVFVVDPTTGAAEALGSFGGPDDVVVPETVTVGDTMLVDTQTRLVAVDLRTAAERWSVPLVGQRFHPPVVAGTTVVAISADGDEARVEAFDIADGRRLWSRPTGAAALRSGPVLRDEVVLVGDPVEALDIDTGEPAWTSTVTDPAGLPVLLNDLLVVTTFADGDDSGRVAGIDAASGAVEWNRELDGEGHAPTSRLVGAGGTAVLTSITGPVIGLDPRTGDERWRQEFPAAIIGTPSAIGDRIWYALESGQVLALSPADGAIEREFEGFGTSIGAVSVIQRPVASGDVVVVAAGPIVYAVREAGP